MSPQDEQWRRRDGQAYSVMQQFSCLTKYNQNINKQNVNIADETLTDYSRYHYTNQRII